MLSRTRAALAAVAATLAITVSQLTTPAAAADQPLPPIASLDVGRYLGTWYQLAGKLQFFNLQCYANTAAHYSAIDADTIRVRNTCDSWVWGLGGSITGTADVTDPTTNAQLRVQFPGFPNFAGAAPNYVVTYLADDYSWALVGDPGRASGFVLSRTKQVSEQTWRQISAVIKSRGYDPCTFVISPQQGGQSWPLPLCWVY